MILLGLCVVVAYISIMYWLPRHDPLDPTAIVPHDLNATYDFGFLRGLVYCSFIYWTAFERQLAVLVPIWITSLAR